MQGNYRTAQPTGLGHLPTLLARLAILRGWTDPFNEPLRPVECAHIGTSSKKFKLGTGDWAGGCGCTGTSRCYSRRLYELLPSGYLACDSARGSNPPANFPQLSPSLISSSQLTKTTIIITQSNNLMLVG
ncbi:hypothetical protein MJO28_003833 [Puccinia striiformis f. sp. tritici]|uniref:Uncharacterized protein n=1 Tax=Puccinia striiformis f. sp. tritici TaxID=168172 RepID=A0ACC0EPC9_9BASI|nr:hypothetical protein MJO28_003833 [Puccinia striiformis f. sp. tritici]